MDNDVPFTRVLAVPGKDVMKSNSTVIKKRQQMYNNINSTIPPYSKPPHIQASKSLIPGQILPEGNPKRNSMVTKTRSTYTQCLSKETESISTSPQAKTQILKSTVPPYRKLIKIQMCRSEMPSQLVGETNPNKSSLVPRTKSRYSQYSVDQMKPRNTTSCYETKWSSKPIGQKYSKKTPATRNNIGSKMERNQLININLEVENQPHSSSSYTIINVNGETRKIYDNEVVYPSTYDIPFITTINLNDRMMDSVQKNHYKPPRGKSNFLEWLHNQRKSESSKISDKCETRTIENEDKKQPLCNDTQKRVVVENKTAEPVNKFSSNRVNMSHHRKTNGKGNSQFSEWLRNKKKESVTTSNANSDIKVTWLTSQTKSSYVKKNVDRDVSMTWSTDPKTDSQVNKTEYSDIEILWVSGQEKVSSLRTSANCETLINSEREVSHSKGHDNCDAAITWLQDTGNVSPLNTTDYSDIEKLWLTGPKRVPSLTSVANFETLLESKRRVSSSRGHDDCNSPITWLTDPANVSPLNETCNCDVEIIWVCGQKNVSSLSINTNLESSSDTDSQKTISYLETNLNCVTGKTQLTNQINISSSNNPTGKTRLTNKKKISLSNKPTDCEIGTAILTGQKKVSSLNISTDWEAGINLSKKQKKASYSKVNSDFYGQRTQLMSQNRVSSKNKVDDYDSETISSTRQEKLSPVSGSEEDYRPQWLEDWMTLIEIKRRHDQRMLMLGSNLTGHWSCCGYGDNMRRNYLPETYKSFKTVYGPNQNQNVQINCSVQDHSLILLKDLIAGQKRRIMRMYQKLNNPDKRDSLMHLKPVSKFPEWLNIQKAKATTENRKYVLDISSGLPIVQHKDPYSFFK